MALQAQQAFKHALKLANSGRSMSSSVLNNVDGKPSVKRANNVSNLHLSVQRDFPQAAALPIPPNIDATETTRFSPQRARDISSNAILIHQSSFIANHIDVTLDNSAAASIDPHVQSYDCNGAVSLNSSMQSNVPSPFGGLHKFTHLNMPGGSWELGNKFLADDLQSSHYMNLRKEVRLDWANYDDKPANDTDACKKGTLGLIDKYDKLLSTQNANNWHVRNVRQFSLNSHHLMSNVENDKEIPKAVSRKDQLKKAVKEYGSTVIIFHVGMSLASLGTCYLLVSSGLDVVSLMGYLGLGDSSFASKVGAGASTFVISYAIHKVFAPVRISITLGATPFIVKYLRKKGILKPAQKIE